jgi:hypothetical protein
LTQFVPSPLAQRYVSGIIQTSLQLTVTVTCDPELYLLKQNWVIPAEWSKRDSLPHSSLAQRYVSGVIQKSLELSVTVTCDTELAFSNRIGLCLQSGVHLSYFVPSFLAQRYVSGILQTSLELSVTVTSYPELDFRKQNCVMSAEWSTLDSIRPFLSYTAICVRGNADISGINI